MSDKMVLDASAVLALLYKEPGWKLVADYLERCTAFLSAVNLSEVMMKQLESGVPVNKTNHFVEILGIVVQDFNMESAVDTASLRRETKSSGLSFADRSCIALGRMLNAPLLTADRAWAELELGIEIVVIR